MTYIGRKRILLLLIGALALTVVAAVVLASLGRKDLDGTFAGPVFLIIFGSIAILGAHVNYRDVGFAFRKGLFTPMRLESMTHHRTSYLLGLVLLVMIGLGMMIYGVVLIVLRMRG